MMKVLTHFANRLTYRWRLLLVYLTVVMLFAAITGASAADRGGIVIDGSHEAAWGAPVAVDPIGDISEPNLDVAGLYVTEDASNYYIGFDAFASSWGMTYGIYIDTDQVNGSGGTSDPWGRNVAAVADHLPEYALYVWHDGGDFLQNAQLTTWNGAGWDYPELISLGGAQAYGAANDWIEYQIPKTALGSPTQIAVELFTTGGSGHAQDSSPSDPNVNYADPDWGGATTTLSSFVLFPPIIIDGVPDANWGTPLATDPLGDISEPNLDLNNLYVTEDANNYYIGFDAFASNWGMTYGIYIDTDQVNGSGGTSDPWGRAVDAVADHLPEFALYVWHDGGDFLQNAQLTTWNGAGWDYPELISLGGAQGYGAANDWIEYQIPKAALGNPAQIAIELFTTGGGGHAQDTVPSDPNVNYADPDWGSDTTTLSAFVIYPTPVLALTVTAPQEGEGFTNPNINVVGQVAPSTGVTVTVDLNGANQYLPAIDGSGVFTQALTLSTGANVITVTADDGANTEQVVRNVSYGASNDNNIWWNELGHNSRDSLFRTPGGPVTTGTPVTVRLRSASGDLTGAQVRYWNDRLDTEIYLPMYAAADDGTYEWWEAVLPASPDPTVYWYRFIAMDGSAIAYYEDDNARTGGWGAVFANSVDNSWQLTMYDGAFTTPDWVKEAVIYQIFTDRFRDGNPANDTPAGSFFYNETPTIVRSNDTNGYWNAPICDPRDGGSDCPGVYSQNFYGGDLQGIIDKLDYLQGLGVTALYLNPIFESPSNHKYDTTNFGVIDDNFGDLALFQTLVTEAHNRGINIILDGVFNHTSSDSIYFDRYNRYPAPDGACESVASTYRNWYYFGPANPPGTGPCAGDTTYTSWFGYDSLPKLNAFDDAVRDYIYAGGPNAIARYWMQWADGWRLDVGGDVDPGTLNDPNNDYWEGFRTAVHQTDPNAYIVGEEWGVATSWTIGDEWDATMNYQFSSAVMSFWRDSTFVDNDHNNGSSAGTLSPITPSQLDERLHNLIERYPPEALYAMMNLLGSHDTNRPLFMLDENTDLNDTTLYQNPNYDWSDAMQRQMGVVLLQMTLPGAPTIYYGDEVGLVGPVTYDGSTWQDDPYNRIPYPWTDETGTAYYPHLQAGGDGQTVLLPYYQTLTTIRNGSPALRLGDFETLLVDDAGGFYAFGRMMADSSDAAVVLINRNPVVRGAAVVEVDVSGYLPIGAQFVDNLNGATPYTVDGGGKLTITVPPMSGAILTLAAPLPAPPDATVLSVASVANQTVNLSWTAAAGAESYDVYRSLVSGGGYVLINNTAGTTYSDTGLNNAQAYYYIVISRNDTTGLLSVPSNEVSAIPQHDLTAAWYNLQWPYEITHTISTITPTENIYAQIWINGFTGGSGPASGIRAQVGYGASASNPNDSWTWFEMGYDQPAGNNDQYIGNMLPNNLGDYDYSTRWSSDNGQTWYYSDISGPGDNDNPGLLHVVASSDTTAPLAPTNLAVTGTTPGSISLAWDANGEPDLAGYELYRQDVGAFDLIAILDAATTSYVDTNVVTDQSYNYYVIAYDTSFNRSPQSNTVTATAEARLVAVTLTVTVPDFTVGNVYFSRVINGDGTFGGWDPAGVLLTQLDATTWETTIMVLDTQPVQFKFTRGTWNMVEKEADGNTEIPDRTFTVDYGGDGTQALAFTVANWRDPIVVDHFPPAGASGVQPSSVISATWSQAMPGNTSFQVDGPNGAVAGTFGYDAATYTVTFTPTAPLELAATYTVTIAGTADVVGDIQQVPVIFTFNTFTPTSVSLSEFSGRPAPVLLWLLLAALPAGLWLRRRRIVTR